MAEEVPVCDVLCEAMEYLSKLGSNLRTRSEALKEKKIRKDKLKNAHAVQKAANKVLLICQLSKKSLDNVESGVKKILTLVDASQASTFDGGKSANSDKPSTSKKIDYQYFEYRSRKLKIAKKVPIKHYMSAKVMARSISKSMQEKYPVYYDCKLYRYRKRKALEEKIQRERSDRQNPKNDSLFKDETSEKKRSSRELVTPELESDRGKKKDKNRGDSETLDSDDLRRKDDDGCGSMNKDKKKLLESDDDDQDSKTADHKEIAKSMEKRGKSFNVTNEPESGNTSGEGSDVDKMTHKKHRESERPEKESQHKSKKNNEDSSETRNSPEKKDDFNNKDNQMESGSNSDDSHINREKTKNKKSEKKGTGSNCNSIEPVHPKKSDEDTIEINKKGELGSQNSSEKSESNKEKVRKRNDSCSSNDSDASEKSLGITHKKDLESTTKSKKYRSDKNKEKRRPSIYLSSDTDEEVQKQKQEKIKAQKKLRTTKAIIDSDSSDEVSNKPEVNMNKEIIDLGRGDDDKKNKPEKPCQEPESEPVKPLIKLVNINKLLKPDILQKEQLTKQPTNEKQNKENKSMTQSRENPRYSAMRSNNKSEITHPKFKKVRYEDEEKFWEPKRKEVEAFIPKKFTINIIRVTKLSKLLHEHNLRKITQHGSVICKLNDDEISLKDSQLSFKNKETPAKETTQLPNISCQLIDSDSDKSESYPVNNLTCESENVKITLLDDSDSEKNNDRETSKDAKTTAKKNSKSKGIDEEDQETIKKTLVDDSDSEKNYEQHSTDLQKDTKKIKSKGSLKDYISVETNVLDESDAEKNVNKNNKVDKCKEGSDDEKTDSEKSDDEKSKRTSKRKSKSKIRNTDEETDSVKNNLLQDSDSDYNKSDAEKNVNKKNKVDKCKEGSEDDKTDSEKSDDEKSKRTSKNKSKSKRRNTDEETDSVKNNLLQDSDSDYNKSDAEKNVNKKSKVDKCKEGSEDDKTDLEKSDDEKSKRTSKKKCKSKRRNTDKETDSVKNNLLKNSNSDFDESDAEKNVNKKNKVDKCGEGSEDDKTDSEKSDDENSKRTSKKKSKSKRRNTDEETDSVTKNLLQDSNSDFENNDKEETNSQKSGNKEENDFIKNKLLDSDSEKNDEHDSNQDLQTTTMKEHSGSKGGNEEDETDIVKSNLFISDSEKNEEHGSDEDVEMAAKKKHSVPKGSDKDDQTVIAKNKLLNDSDSDNNDDQDINLQTELNESNTEVNDETDVSHKNFFEENSSMAHSKETKSNKQDINKTPDKEISPSHEDSDKVKSSSQNDSSDHNLNKPGGKKRKRNSSTPQSKRKHIMESMHAKKMLLTYSSSSETEDEKLKEVLKDIKKSLLQSMSSDEEKVSKDSHRRKLYTSSDSDEDILKRAKKKRKKRTKRSSVEEVEEVKKGSDNEKENGETTKDHSNINQIDGTMDETSNCSKMGRSREKAGGSSHNSDNQNDKDVDSLTNLESLNTSRSRRRGSVEKPSTSSKKKVSKAPPLITGEGLLEAPTSSSDDASAANSDAVEEDLPPVTMSGLNGGAIDHLAKDDLLGESDSSSSNKDKDESSNEKEDDEDIKQENESDAEKNIKTKRRKAHAISSDSEAGSSRPKGSNRNRVSDFEDSDADSDQVKKNKRKKKVATDSDASGRSSNEGSKKKRRRIKQIDDSDASGSDSENEGKKHGRKNIRKVMGKNQLEEATKKAAREERERCARIAERQKMYNNLEFDESGKPDEVVLDKVVLDFDPETKEPLIEVDRGLVKKLKPHQANGIKFMWDACFESVKRIKKARGSGCILAHCMGLGKTLQVVTLTHTLLTHSDLTSVNRVLVVCPLSTVLNWVNEFKMWLKYSENDFEVDVYELSRYKQNSERAFQLSQWFEHGGVCVLGYEMFRNLSADNNKKFKKKMLKNFQESLVDPGPDMVVCDEGHLLKNEKTSLSQSMNRVKTHRRIVLTGTPLQNNLKEYYCMVQFVKPNLLGKYNEYLNRFVNPITNGQYTDSTDHDIRIMKRRSHVLHKMLDGAVQRRDYGVLAPFLPPKHEYVLFITLTDVQIKLYQHYLDNYSRRPLPGKSSGFLFPDFQSLQRIWTHPLVLKYNSERYEILQQKKRDKEEEDSEGSLADFIDDESTPDESTSESQSDDSSEASDDSRKKRKKKKNKSKKEAKTTRRGTRSNPVEPTEEEEDKDLSELIEVKNDNPTEWWIPMVTEDEVEDMRNSHKLVLLFEILRQCEAIGDKLLVFSQSLYSLDLIEYFLGKVDEATQEGRIEDKLCRHVGSWSPGVDYFRLDGSTSCENRSIWCKNFNREDNPRARLFLISTRAGGLGINLVAANRVIIFDVSWNPSHDVQSIFRVYRFGQKKPCYVYRFLVMGTMEEKIYERQVTKQAISKRVIDEQQIDRHYAENDLAELYKFEPRHPEPRPVPLVPKDRLFAEMLKDHEAAVYKFHEHDSLLENKEEETLSEEERKAAWEDFENEKNKPPPVPFANTWPMHNGMVPNLLAQQQQQLAYAALSSMLRKDMPNLSDDQIRGMLPLIYGANPGLMQKLGDIYKYPQPSMMNPAAMMNSVMNPGGVGMGGGGTSGLQYEPPWARDQRDQQNMRLQQLLQQQNQMGAKYYAGGLGSRDPVAMALQQQRAREIMLGEQARQRGRPPLQPRAPPTAPPPGDVVNLADSD